MKITGNGRARLQSCPPVLTGPRRFVFSQRQPSRNQTICLAFSLRPSRLSGEKALSGINREDAKSAKNPRRRILSKRQRICTLVVYEEPLRHEEIEDRGWRLEDGRWETVFLSSIFNPQSSSISVSLWLCG